MRRIIGGRLLHPKRHDTAQAALKARCRPHEMNSQDDLNAQTLFFHALSELAGVSVPVESCKQKLQDLPQPSR